VLLSNTKPAETFTELYRSVYITKWLWGPPSFLSSGYWRL